MRRRGPTGPPPQAVHRSSSARAALSADPARDRDRRSSDRLRRPARSSGIGGLGRLAGQRRGGGAVDGGHEPRHRLAAAPDPAGVDTNSTSAIRENTIAPPATRAFAQITAPRIENKINAPTLCITDHPPRARGEGHRAGRTHPTGSPALDRHPAGPLRGGAPRPQRRVRPRAGLRGQRRPPDQPQARQLVDLRPRPRLGLEHRRQPRRPIRRVLVGQQLVPQRPRAARTTSSRCSNTLLIGPPSSRLDHQRRSRKASPRS